MGPITILEGQELADLLKALTDPRANIYALRFHQTGDGKIKIKANGGMWSPPLGELDA